MTDEKDFGRRALIAAAIMGSWLAAGTARAGDSSDTGAQTPHASTYGHDAGSEPSGTSARDTTGSDASTGLTGGETTGRRHDKTAAGMVDAERARSASSRSAPGAAAQGNVNMDDTDITTGNRSPDEAVDTTHADEMGSGATGRSGPGYEGTSGGTGSGDASGSGTAGAR